MGVPPVVAQLRWISCLAGESESQGNIGLVEALPKGITSNWIAVLGPVGSDGVPRDLSCGLLKVGAGLVTGGLVKGGLVIGGLVDEGGLVGARLIRA